MFRNCESSSSSTTMISCLASALALARETSSSALTDSPMNTSSSSSSTAPPGILYREALVTLLKGVRMENDIGKVRNEMCSLCTYFLCERSLCVWSATKDSWLDVLILQRRKQYYARLPTPTHSSGELGGIFDSSEISNLTNDIFLDLAWMI